MNANHILWALLIPLGVGLGACAPAPSDPGQMLYAQYCVTCHGSDARGTGPLAQDLPIAPADLTTLASGDGGVFPSARVMEKIYGYPGRFQSDVMPEFGPLLEGPTVLWQDEDGTSIETPRALLQLRDYLASLQTP